MNTTTNTTKTVEIIKDNGISYEKINSISNKSEDLYKFLDKIKTDTLYEELVKQEFQYQQNEQIDLLQDFIKNGNKVGVDKSLNKRSFPFLSTSAYITYDSVRELPILTNDVQLDQSVVANPLQLSNMGLSIANIGSEIQSVETISNEFKTIINQYNLGAMQNALQDILPRLGKSFINQGVTKDVSFVQILLKLQAFAQMHGSQQVLGSGFSTHYGIRCMKQENINDVQGNYFPFTSNVAQEPAINTNICTAGDYYNDLKETRTVAKNYNIIPIVSSMLKNKWLLNVWTIGFLEFPLRDYEKQVNFKRSDWTTNVLTGARISYFFWDTFIPGYKQNLLYVICDDWSISDVNNQKLCDIGQNQQLNSWTHNIYNGVQIPLVVNLTNFVIGSNVERSDLAIEHWHKMFGNEMDEKTAFALAGRLWHKFPVMGTHRVLPFVSGNNWFNVLDFHLYQMNLYEAMDPGQGAVTYEVSISRAASDHSICDTDEWNNFVDSGKLRCASLEEKTNQYVIQGIQTEYTMAAACGFIKGVGGRKRRITSTAYMFNTMIFANKMCALNEWFRQSSELMSIPELFDPITFQADTNSWIDISQMLSDKITLAEESYLEINLSYYTRMTGSKPVNLLIRQFAYLPTVADYGLLGNTIKSNNSEFQKKKAFQENYGNDYFDTFGDMNDGSNKIRVSVPPDCQKVNPSTRYELMKKPQNKIEDWNDIKWIIANSYCGIVLNTNYGWRNSRGNSDIINLPVMLTEAFFMAPELRLTTIDIGLYPTKLIHVLGMMDSIQYEGGKLTPAPWPRLNYYISITQSIFDACVEVDLGVPLWLMCTQDKAHFKNRFHQFNKIQPKTMLTEGFQMKILDSTTKKDEEKITLKEKIEK